MNKYKGECFPIMLAPVEGGIIPHTLGLCRLGNGHTRTSKWVWEMYQKIYKSLKLLQKQKIIILSPTTIALIQGGMIPQSPEGMIIYLP